MRWGSWLIDEVVTRGFLGCAWQPASPYLGEKPLCRADRVHQRYDSHDLHDAFKVVGEHVQAHLGAHPRQSLGQEMRRAHPRFEGGEGMLGSLSAQAHGVWRLIEPSLHSLQDSLVLPA